MCYENSIYTVTPPDIKLVNGPTCLLLGITSENIKPFHDLYDIHYSDSEVVMYVSEDHKSPDNISWYRAVAGIVDTIFIDLSAATREEIIIALHAEYDTNTNVYWLAPDDTDKFLLNLVNSYKHQIFKSLDDFNHFLMEKDE